ncbi:MAG: hypothetical protein IPJ78_09255 [Gemmatimonadetes bacterium]|nr:hypothetical protein [Gemmatimonadota bacterium]MBP7550251.1 hypothetical protein [Gemmatimonadaceae bacterium]
MRRLLAGTALLAAVSVPANAQCAAGVTQDACQKATDLWAYMMPQIGTSLVGGSHTLGIGTTLGGLGHFAIALRGNAVMGDLPDLSGLNVSLAGAQNSNIAANEQIIGLPGVDFAVGLFKGLPLGVTRVGGVDLIGSVTYVPDIEGDGVSLAASDGNTKVGLGARVGLLEQSLIVPGVSVSYLVRDLPTMSVTAAASNADFALNDFSVKTTSWRVAAQKNLLLFQLGAGFGQDTYDASSAISGTVTGGGGFTASPSQELKRTTMYGSLGFNLLIAKVVAEVGQVSGGEVTTFNTFSEAADKTRLYGSVGIRISF